MRLDELVAALALPPGSRVNRRVSKKLLAEHVAKTAADRRRINEGLEELRWVAALKPTNTGVAAFRDAEREYLEIAVLSADLRETRSSKRLAKLIHRSVPYPVVLIAVHRGELNLSLAEKRRSRVESGASVIDGDVVAVEDGGGAGSEISKAFLAALAFDRQPLESLFSVYQGWLNALLAFLAAQLTGVFRLATSTEQMLTRQEALYRCAVIEKKVARVKGSALRETQIARRVELNLEAKRLEQEYENTRAGL